MDFNFQELRQNAHLSRQACADYFDVHLSTVNRWDNGKVSPPFATCELLRVIAGKLPALSLRYCFSGWSFGGDYLYTPNGERFTAEDIKDIRFLRASNADYRGQIVALKAKIKELENSKPSKSENVIQFSDFYHQQKQG